MVDDSGTSDYSYDPFGELTSQTNGADKITGYSYDALGQQTGVTYPLGSPDWALTDTVSYSYDPAGELDSVSDFEGNTIAIADTEDGLPATEALGGTGDTVTTSYDNTDAPSEINLSDGSTLLDFSYERTPSGGIASETDTPSSDLEPADYDYSAQGWVTSDEAGTSGTESYSEDQSGNLSTLPDGASASYDDASELSSSSLGDATTDYTYDADGERTEATQGLTTLVSASYNGAEELTSYDDSAADLSSATYDGNGLRTSDTVTPSGGSASTQGFVWDTASSMPELLMDGTNAYIYAGGGAPAEQVDLSTGAITYLVTDALGSVRGVVDSSGDLDASTSYDAWGNAETEGGLTSYTPFGFAGGYTDATGLIYLIHRYYGPATGQFLTVDPELQQTQDPYGYAGDDPVDVDDPMGLSWWNPCDWGHVCHHLHNVVDGIWTSIKNGYLWLNEQTAAVICHRGVAPAPGSPASDYLGCQDNPSGYVMTVEVGNTLWYYNWGRFETLSDHYDRHGPDFGSSSPEEYAQQASDFLRQMVKNGEIKINPDDGVIRAWDPATKSFGSYNPDGSTKTYYIRQKNPDDYWNVQPGDEPIWIGEDDGGE
jgi:RHS repeat-associated protein